VPKRQNPAKAVRTPANKLDTARQDFFLAMQQLAEEQIPNNPYSALVEDVLSKWRDAGSTPGPTTPGKRFRFRTSDINEAAKRTGRRRAIIEEWARRFWLLGTDGEPADWIVAYAEVLCQKLSGEWRDGPTMLSQLNSVSGPRQLDPWIGALVIPMTDPTPREGERFAHFKKRARHALTVHLHQLESTHGRNNAVVPVTPQSADYGPKKLYFRWLVLYQCCKWKLSQIHAASGYSVGNPKAKDFNAIYQAIKRTAALLQLSLRVARA
jgi:hypothetical protein